jgi:hypothetical protein
MIEAFDLAADLVELAPYVPPPVAPLRETTFRVNAWLPDENDRLRAMFFADEPIAAIAEQLGRPFHGVRAQIDKFGLRRNSTRPWTDMEDAELFRRYGTTSAARLALDLGRSVSAVYARAGLLELSETMPADYDGWEDAQIRAGYGRGVPVGQIATLIGRPLLGVRSRASDLGLRHKCSPAGWSEEEITRALELAQAGHRYQAIVEQLVADGFPRRSTRGFGLKIRAVGYGRGWGRKWLPEEDELLRRAYAAGASLTPLLDRLGRSRTSIRWRVGYLGLQGTHANKNGFRQGPDWSKADEARLREAYGKVNSRALAEELGRGYRAMLVKANALGLKHGYCKLFSEDEDRAIVIAWHKGVSMVDVAKALGRDPAVIGKHANRLGYRFNDPSRPVKGPKTRRADRVPVTLGSILAMEAAA